MSRTIPEPLKHVLVLVARLTISFVMLAHVWLTFVQQGFGNATDQFTNFGIPLAIVATAFTLVVELVGSFLLAAGIFVPWAAAGIAFVMYGAIFFVHGANGVFVKNNGFELVAMIAGICLAIAAFGPGKYSLDHLLFDRRKEEVPAPVDVASDPSGVPVSPAPRAYAGHPAPRWDEPQFGMARQDEGAFGRPAPSVANRFAVQSRPADGQDRHQPVRSSASLSTASVEGTGHHGALQGRQQARSAVQLVEPASVPLPARPSDASYRPATLQSTAVQSSTASQSSTAPQGGTAAQPGYGQGAPATPPAGEPRRSAVPAAVRSAAEQHAAAQPRFESARSAAPAVSLWEEAPREEEPAQAPQFSETPQPQYARYADPAYVAPTPQSRIAAAFVQASRNSERARSESPAWDEPETDGRDSGESGRSTTA
ncbi:DoxX family membrane protein [Pseudonocardia ailaonensis]